jgi:glutathione S-transferase
MFELYQAEGCPHCQKVREKLTDIGVSYITHNPRLADGDVCNPQSYDELLALGGKDQIPFLVDHLGERTLYESDDIIAYLEEHYGEISKARV